jgi:hypothetical protein
MAQDTNFEPQDEQIPGPENAKTYTGEFSYHMQSSQTRIEDVRHWRTECRIRIGYDGSQYERPELL